MKINIEDVITWDIPNWSRALKFIDKNKSNSFHGKKVLEIGAAGCGLSIWVALKRGGGEVICSDLSSNTNCKR